MVRGPEAAHSTTLVETELAIGSVVGEMIRTGLTRQDHKESDMSAPVKDERGEYYKPCTCGQRAYWNDSCASYLCSDCGAHADLERCWCGWSRSGGDGRRELIEMGENLE